MFRWPPQPFAVRYLDVFLGEILDSVRKEKVEQFAPVQLKVDVQIDRDELNKKL